MISDDLKTVYREMAEMTKPECGKCRIPHSCCSPEYCEMAIEYAQQVHGITLARTSHPRLPLLDPETHDCTAPPHLRPPCTMHTCDINSIGAHRTDPEWTHRYFALRWRIEKLELGL